MKGKRGDPNVTSLYTTFWKSCDDDVIYWGQIFKPRLQIKMEEFQTALQRIPDQDIIPSSTTIPAAATYSKRPTLSYYEKPEEHGWIRDIFLAEALITERIAKAPHPNIVRYHGCRIRNGRLTSILESAVHHLHSLGLAHNDLAPPNIMVSGGREPILIDFSSCQPFGKRLMQGGTAGWRDDEPFSFSDKQHDLVALELLRKWISNPNRIIEPMGLSNGVQY
ncbi:kinase-like protein [Xylariaceae sp. FL0662B]|nr:kinase-like protein [Xylariaceae sp. FL0662B]